MPHRLGNAQTNPVVLGGSGGQELGQLITTMATVVTAGEDAVCHCTRLDWGVDGSQSQKQNQP